MATTTTSEDPENDKPLAIVRASDIEKSGSQVAVLCQIIETVGPWIREHLEPGCVVNCAPGTQEEATKTFELANIRLRDIIDDEAGDRWSLKPTGAEEASSRVLETYRLKAEAQTELVQSLLKPHRRLNPQIRYFPGTGWVVWMGGAIPYGHDLHGRGDTPALAHAAFDRAYNEQMPLLQKQVEVPAPDTPPAPAPKARTRSILRAKKKK